MKTTFKEVRIGSIFYDNYSGIAWIKTSDCDARMYPENNHNISGDYFELDEIVEIDRENQ